MRSSFVFGHRASMHLIHLHGRDLSFVYLLQGEEDAMMPRHFTSIQHLHRRFLISSLPSSSNMHCNPLLFLRPINPFAPSSRSVSGPAVYMTHLFLRPNIRVRSRLSPSIRDEIIVTQFSSTVSLALFDTQLRTGHDPELKCGSGEKFVALSWPSRRR